MAKPELGLKRICVSCGTRFYDLAKSPAACPKCGTEQPVEQPRAKRSGNVVDLRKPKKAVVAEDAEADPEVEAEGDEAEEGVLEDSADLDDDEDDALGTNLEVEPEGDEPER